MLCMTHVTAGVVAVWLLMSSWLCLRWSGSSLLRYTWLRQAPENAACGSRFCCWLDGRAASVITHVTATHLHIVGHKSDVCTASVSWLLRLQHCAKVLRLVALLT
jgi:hypothetical protein